MENLCGLKSVRFSNQKFAVAFVLEVEARHDLVDDPGVVKLIRNALDFRGADGIVVMSGPERVVVRLGEPVFARLRNGGVLETAEPVTEAELALLEQGGLPLAERLARDEGEATAS